MSKSYILNGSIYDVDENEIGLFLKGNPDAKEYLGGEVTSDLVSEDEEDAVTKLNNNWNHLGFSFEQSGIGDYITAKNHDGSVEKTFSFDNWTDASNAKVAAEMNQWMSENKMPEYKDMSFGDVSGKDLQEKSVGSLGWKVEKKAVKHLNSLYKDKGVWFEEAIAGKDVVRVHKGGKSIDIDLPNNWDDSTGDWFQMKPSHETRKPQWDVAAAQINNFIRRTEGTAEFREQEKQVFDSVLGFLNSPEKMASIGANENPTYNVRAEKNPDISDPMFGEGDERFTEIMRYMKDLYGTTNSWYALSLIHI